MTGGRSLATGALGCAALAACVLLACARGTPLDSDAELEHWQRVTTRIRGRVFLEPVRLEIITPAQIPSISRGELVERYDEGFIAAYRDAYAALGLFPPDLDLLEEMLALQGEQLVGLYSPSRRTLYVVSEPGDIAGGSEAIFVHELVHALQDQHFPVTMALLQWLEHNDDVAAAISAAVEGDASFSMMGIPFDEDLSRTSVSAERMREAMLHELAEPGGVMGEVPRFLRVSLIFPYAYGVTLAQARWREAGNDGLDDLVREPPLSSLRVLYPDDTDPVEFVNLPEGPLAELLGRRGCELRHHNVAGVASTRVLFEDYGAGEDLEPLLRSWSGDRFQHVVCNGHSELIWLTRWDSSGAALEFAERYRSIAPAIGEASRLSGEPQVSLQGRTVLILSPGVAPARELLLEGAQIRAYDSFADWFADGCFPESPVYGRSQPPMYISILWRLFGEPERAICPARSSE